MDLIKLGVRSLGKRFSCGRTDSRALHWKCWREPLLRTALCNMAFSPFLYGEQRLEQLATPRRMQLFQNFCKQGENTAVINQAIPFSGSETPLCTTGDLQHGSRGSDLPGLSHPPPQSPRVPEQSCLPGIWKGLPGSELAGE